MASPLSLVFFITNCRVKAGSQPRLRAGPPVTSASSSSCTTTNAVRIIIITHDHRRRRHARPPSLFASSLTSASSSWLLGADLRSGGTGPARRRHASLLPPAPVTGDGLGGRGALQQQATKQLRPATDGRSGLKESMPGNNGNGRTR
ncbi:hypothetical protein TRIUR3_29203 [Triticum urartu]|uniref:Uncharacterized protein n=1 Tax=Triticum urartu TaxID=4572 RepID=M7ZD12_TRIUA|nr:hypothetical protein TRIUR3_29203 [Triticum urartu]